MADALVSIVLEQLTSIIRAEIEEEVRLVVGVQKEVQKLDRNFQVIRAVLGDAERRQVREEAVRIWLDELKDVAYEMEDVLDEWSTAILKSRIQGSEYAPVPRKKVSSFHIPSPCFCFNQVVLRHDIALKIKDVSERLDAVSDAKDRYNFRLIGVPQDVERPRTTSFIDVSEVRGRGPDKNALVSKLLSESSEEEEGSFQIISLVGMGGIGKTALAQLAYENDSVKGHFETRIWVCVSDPFDEVRIAKAIIEVLEGDAPNIVELQPLLQRIGESIFKKKFLLVLDDVWNEDYRKWEPLKNSLRSGAKGSRILVTTRSERVAKIMGTTYTLALSELSDEECWSVFSQIAFFGRSREERECLEEIGWKISKRCKGLPLAAKTLGSLMRFKRSKQDWQNVLDSELWELEEARRDIISPLWLSYYDLPSPLKQCFSYCAIFPKDKVIVVDELIKLWMANGYLNCKGSTEMEERGCEYFENLAMRSLFQDFVTKVDGSIECCKMHDIVHDFAQFLTKNECHSVEVYGVETQKLDTSFVKKPRHLALALVTEEVSLPLATFKCENVRTFLLARTASATTSATALRSLFQYSTSLRALDLSKQSIVDLPRELGKLIHLRYLNLDGNPFEELPETLSGLWNLQTLNLVLCHELKKLPLGIPNLINLRHLEIRDTTHLSWLPKGLGRLSSLRTLNKFNVCLQDDREACLIGELENLNYLQGRLEIIGLGKFSEVGEVENAGLKNKKNIKDLNLSFASSREVGAAEWRKDEEIIKALEPPPYLENLEVWGYGGTHIPNWVTSLANLRKLRLESCRRCVHLPSLGNLPSLESLKIHDMRRLKNVGHEFLGITRTDDDIPRTNVHKKVISFPKLKNLIFSALRKWEEWEVSSDSTISIMPCLHSLSFLNCPRLKALPCRLQTLDLQEFTIIQCPILRKRCQNETGEDWAKISCVGSINIIL